MQDDRLIVALDESGGVERFGLEKGEGRSKRIEVDWGDGLLDVAESGPRLKRITLNSLELLRLVRPEVLRKVASEAPSSLLAALAFENNRQQVAAASVTKRLAALGIDLPDFALKQAREQLATEVDVEITGTRPFTFRWRPQTAGHSHPLANVMPKVDDLVVAPHKPAKELQDPAASIDLNVLPSGDGPEIQPSEEGVGAGCDDVTPAEEPDAASPLDTTEQKVREPRAGSLADLVERARESAESIDVEAAALAMLARRDARAKDLGHWLELAEISVPWWRETSQIALYEHVGRIVQNDNVDLDPHIVVLRRLLGKLPPLSDRRWRALILPLSARRSNLVDDAAVWAKPQDDHLDIVADAAVISDRRLRDSAASHLARHVDDRPALVEASRLLALPEALRRSVGAETYADVFRDAARSSESVAAWMQVLDRSSEIDALERRGAAATEAASRVQVLAEQSTARAEGLQRLVDDLRDQLNGAAAQRSEVADRERLRVQRRALRGIAQQLTLLDEELGISHPDALRAHARSLAERLGVRPFADVGDLSPFDPLKHESPESPSNGDLVTVVRAGYTSASDEEAVLVKALVAITRDEEWPNRN